MKLWKRFKAMPHVVHLALLMVLLVGLTALAGCATRVQSEDEVILTPAQREKCAAGGGCVTLSRKALRSLVEEAVKIGQRGSI